MSIILGLMGKSQCCLASDTLGALPDGRALCIAKSFTLPHLRGALATRGHIAFNATLMAALQNFDQPLTSFDELLPALPEILRVTHQTAVAIVDAHGASDALQVVVCGWSDAERRPIGVAFDNAAPGQQPDFRSETVGDAFTRHSLPQGYFWMPGLRPHDHQRILSLLNRKLAPRELLTEVAKAQRRVDPDHERVIGGRLIMHTIGAVEVTSRSIFEWPDFREQLQGEEAETSSA